MCDVLSIDTFRRGLLRKGLAMGSWRVLLLVVWLRVLARLVATDGGLQNRAKTLWQGGIRMPESRVPRKQFGKMSEPLMDELDKRSKALDMTRRAFTELTLTEALGLVSAPPTARRGSRAPEASQTATDRPGRAPVAVVAETPAMARQRKLNEARRPKAGKGKA